MTGTEIAISCAIAIGTLVVIVINIERHSSNENAEGRDRSGTLLLKNFSIAIAGCAALFWYWGYFEEVGQKWTEIRADGPAFDCSSPKVKRAMQALRYCIDSDSCSNTAADIEQVLAYKDACPLTPEELYPDGCKRYDPIRNAFVHLEAADCVSLDNRS